MDIKKPAIDLSGKIAIITGATGQLGQVITKTLALCGADIAIHYYKNESKAISLINELSAIKRKSVKVQFDVGNFCEIEKSAKYISTELGDPDIVVTNAVSQIFPWKPVLEEDIDDYENQFKTCILHNVNIAKIFIPAMIKKKYGRFIGINTECTVQLEENQSAYASAKRGMDGLLKVLAKEVGKYGITVNQVAPGWTITEEVRRKGTEKQEKYQNKIPLRRRGTDIEISNVVAFLASDLASFITGAFIPVTGGNIML